MGRGSVARGMEGMWGKREESEDGGLGWGRGVDADVEVRGRWR